MPSYHIDYVNDHISLFYTVNDHCKYLIYDILDTYSYIVYNKPHWNLSIVLLIEYLYLYSEVSRLSYSLDDKGLKETQIIHRII